MDRRGLVSMELGGVVVSGCNWSDFFPRRLIFLTVGRLLVAGDCRAFCVRIEAFRVGAASTPF